MVGTESFEIMLQEFGEIANNYFNGKETFERLKQEYKDKINSTRTFDKIHDIKTLIRVLEKRDVVRYDDISELKSIEQRFINNERTKKLIADYEQWLTENLPNISDLYAHGKSLSPSNDKRLHENVASAHGNVICEVPSNCTIEDPNEETHLCQKIPTHNVEQPNKICHEISSKNKCFPKITHKIWVLSITLALILLMGGIICHLYILSNSPSAVVPEIAEPGNVPEISDQSSIPPHRIPSGVNIGVTTRTTISVKQVHHGVNQALNSLHQDREKELQCLVLREISKKVGRHWKDISRKLNLQESVLEEIEVKYSDEVMSFQKMFNQAVEIYFAENHPNWKLQLLQALESARRRDLKETALEIIHGYSSTNS